MREILFRGKRRDNGEWVYGDLMQVPTRNFYSIFEQTSIALNFLVDPATVGQYTGLTDKNGVKIFEGDIVDCWSEGVNAHGEVQQRSDGLWIIYPAWQKQIMWGLCPDRDGCTAVEVIGNIHDQPGEKEG